MAEVALVEKRYAANALEELREDTGRGHLVEAVLGDGLVGEEAAWHSASEE